MAAKETGFRCQYSVGEAEGKGLGVFAREPIKQGSVVWHHDPGIFIVYDERSFRAAIEGMSPVEVVYELTHVHAFEEFPGCLIRALDDGILINHSSDPNLATKKNNIATGGLEIDSPHYLRQVAKELVDDRYSLVAIRDIEIGEEIANDYAADDDCPAYYDELYERYGVREDYLNVGQLKLQPKADIVSDSVKPRIDRPSWPVTIRYRQRQN